MAQQAYPTLQGEAQSWANISAKATLYDGPSIDLSDIAGLSWENPVERAVQRRTDGQIKARTRGQATPTAKVSFYADGAQTFIEKLIDIAIAKGYVDNGEALYGMVGFDILVQHTPLGTTSIRQVEILGCCLSKDAADHAEGTDADKNELELSVVRIVRTVNAKRGRIL
jgi:hypothetical protein